MAPHDDGPSAAQAPALSNAEIADRLAGLAQLLSTQKENPYKVKAYHRAAARIRSLSESLDELVKEDADLTQFAGIGEAIASAIREIVLTGKLETLRGQAAPEVATLADYPRLDPKRVIRIYKKLHISSIEELRGSLESGEIESALGLRMAQHVRQGLSEAHSMLLYRADDLRDSIEEFLRSNRVLTGCWRVRPLRFMRQEPTRLQIAGTCFSIAKVHSWFRPSTSAGCH